MEDLEILDKEIKEQMLKYDSALKTLENQINILNKDFEIKKNYSPIEHVKGRIKTLESATKKLTKKGYEISLDNIINHIHDMVGLRIVCAFIDDVYDLVKIIKNCKQIMVTSEKDYIKNPKETGYTSYHMLVKIPIYFIDKEELIEAEIQIRTESMDFWATLNHKISYKLNNAIPKSIKDEMYKCSLDIKKLDKKIFHINKIVKKYKNEKRKN